ncbi:MAG: hypothetical protein ACI4OR_04100, partial [Alphaproteobacteria bacterium]
EILNELQKRAITASQQRFLGNNINLAEFGNDSRVEGYPLVTANDYHGNSEFFTFTVQEVPQRICNQMINNRLAFSVLTAVNGEEADDLAWGSCPNDTNNVSFVFENTLDGHQELNGDGNKDENGACLGGYTGENCDEKITCQNGGTWTKNGCECPDGWYGKSCDTDCDGFKDKKGKCYTCSESTSIATTEEECGRCESRQMDSSGYCALKECPDDKPMADWYGHETCYACDYSGLIRTAEEMCDKCDNRHMVFHRGEEFCYFKECPTDRPIKDSNGYCYTCDEAVYPIRTEKEECDKCDNRHWFVGGSCFLKCPEDKPLQDIMSGYCYSCEVTKAVQTTEDICSKCSNRNMVGDNCLERCPADKPLQDINGTCYTCDEAAGVQTSEAMCNKCSNRNMVGDKCFKACPEDEPLQDVNGTCYACGGKKSKYQSITTTQKECDKCHNTYLKNAWPYGRCLWGCPDDKPIMSLEGECYPCDYWGSILLTDPDANGDCERIIECISSEECFSYLPDCPDDRPLLVWEDMPNLELRRWDCLPCDYPDDVIAEEWSCTYMCNRSIYADGEYEYCTL